MTPETLLQEAATEVDESFINRALDDADINAVRMALYQATGDESLLSVGLVQLPVYGGATIQTVVDDAGVAYVRQKAIKFLLDPSSDFATTVPSDRDLRRMYEAFRDERLDDREWAYRRDLGAFDEHPRQVNWNSGRPESASDFQVAVIGGGFGGIGIGVQLAHLGIPFTIFERRDEVGGTWSRNTYPDVRVDTINFLYQFFFEKNYPWKQYFPRGHEVREYLEHVATKYDVSEHVQFGSDVTDAVFDEETGLWTVTVSRGRETSTVTANAIVAASGVFANPKRPTIPGIDEFRGRVVHTAECNGSEDFTDERVAVIGNGSTGVQMLSAVHRQVESLAVFQRTPQWIAPRERYGDAIIPETRWLLNTMPYYWNWYCYSIATMRLAGQLTQEPDAEWKAKGGLVSEANDNVRATLTAYIQTKVGHRPGLVEKLTPSYAPMARRMVVDNKWYQTILEDNVELITDGIEAITSTGIRTTDGVEREFDTILTATGFEVEKYLWPTDFRGIDGARISEVFEDPSNQGPRAYASITHPQFPNLYIVYGPNSQNRSGSLIVWMEMWAKYISEALVHQIEGGYRSIAVRQSTFNEYNVRLDEAMKKLIWNDPDSSGRNYYVNEYGRQQVNIPWRLTDHHELLAEFRPADYDVK